MELICGIYLLKIVFIRGIRRTLRLHSEGPLFHNLMGLSICNFDSRDRSVLKKVMKRW